MVRVRASLIVATWVAIATTGVALPARAACVDVPALMAQRALKGLPMSLVAPGPQFGHDAGSSRPHDNDGSSIVGFWQFTFTSKGNNVPPVYIPDGAALDQGFAQWHSDETEIMNSSRDPATSNFCLGVWEQTGKQTYRLNHYALSWDNTGKFCTPDAGASSCLIGPTNIRETITVEPGSNSYHGKVTIDQYDNEQHLMLHLEGTVRAHRITAS